MDLALVDTDVMSYIVKRDSRAAFYQPWINASRAGISFMTVAELTLWSLKSNWGSARQEILRFQLDKFSRFQSNEEISKLWAEVTQSVNKQGRHILTADAWNAAIALHYNIPLITHNRRDYDAVPYLKLLSMNKS